MELHASFLMTKSVIYSLYQTLEEVEEVDLINHIILKNLSLKGFKKCATMKHNAKRSTMDASSSIRGKIKSLS